MQLPHCLWYDNFSKIHRIHNPNVGQGVYHSCLWTGVAINVYRGPEVNMTVKYRDDGSVLPVMPDDIFEERTTVEQSITYITQQGMFYYDHSLVKKYNVNNVPLKPNIPDDDPLSVGMRTGSNSMEYSAPLHMLHDNIGSNIGLIKILRRYYEERGMHNDQCTQYHCLNVDENIFWRTIKVVYNVSFECVNVIVIWLLDCAACLLFI